MVLTGLFVAYFAFHNRNTLEQYERDAGISFAQSLAHSSALGVIAQEPSLLEQTFYIAMNDQQVLYVAVYDSNGKILRSSSKIDINLSVTPQETKVPLSASQAYLARMMKIGDADIDDFYSPIQYEREKELSESLLEEGGKEGAALRTVGFLRLGLSRERINVAVRTATLVSLAMGAFVMVFGILLSIYISRLIIRPLKQLELGTKRISQGDLEVSLEISTEDEVGAVARAFNAMTGALRDTTVSKDYVDNIVGSMNEAMVVLDTDRTITTMNRAAEMLLGYKTSELDSTPVDAIFPKPEGHPLDSARWQSLFIVGSLSNIPAEFRAKDGRHIPVNISAAPIYDRGGNSHGLVCVARDMREINALLEKLRTHAEDLERYQGVLFSMLDDNEQARAEIESERQKTLMAVNSMSDGLIMFARDGKVVLSNPAAISMLDMPMNKTAASADFQNVLGSAFEPFTKGNSSEDRLRITQDITLNELNQRTIRVEGLPLEREGQLIGSMLVLRDITKQRQLDEAKFELIANVSHELRTPLAIISNVISNAKVGVMGTLTEKMMAGLEICQNNASRLSHIINKLLNVATIDAGKTALKKEKTDLATLVKEQFSQHEKEAKDKDITISLSIAEGHYVVSCDIKAITEVISNLLSNAIRYTQSGGKVAAMMARRGNQIEVSVEDTGKGIPPEEQKSIFEYFHQVGRTFGPGEKGVGLGLAISRRMIELHGGSIGVTSTVGKGSRFYFMLPADQENS